LAGACAYASNYPPVGEYLSATEISFTGTPEYEIVLKDNGGGTITRESGSLFSVPASYTVQSFSDKTGAPGIVKCIVPANPAVIGASRSCSGMVTLSASSPGAIIEWYADVAATSTLHIGANYTTPEIETSTTYYVQARVGDCLSARVPVLAVITAGCCTAPGATGITFAKFNPCAGYPYGSTYTLIDDRDQKTYKVKYMPDGRYWMVQDLMFGNCTESSWKNDDSEAATKVEPTVAPDYMGHCRSTTVSGVGYFYNWPAAMNNSKAFYSSTTTDFDCSGTGASANACQGICPTGWHLPTGKTDGEIYTLHTALVVYTSCTDRKCWENPAMPEVLPGGYVAPDGTFWCITGWRYYTSTAYDRYTTYEHQACSLFWAGDKTANVDRRWGFNVRCVRNY
jgi:uncharacterized protein (TIGR02145 family)